MQPSASTTMQSRFTGRTLRTPSAKSSTAVTLSPGRSAPSRKTSPTSSRATWAFGTRNSRRLKSRSCGVAPLVRPCASRIAEISSVRLLNLSGEKTPETKDWVCTAIGGGSGSPSGVPAFWRNAASAALRRSPSAALRPMRSGGSSGPRTGSKTKSSAGWTPISNSTAW